MSQAEKRSVATDALETLGSIITEGGRDAIHLAVERVTAGQMLRPGDHIGFVDGKASASAEKYLGIVDPFLLGLVQPGEQFWMVVYPRQITSLRHVWSHPDFPEESVRHEVNVKIDTTEALKQLSKEYLEGFAGSSGMSYDELIVSMKHYLGRHSDGNSSLTLAGLSSGTYVDDEFWEHYGRVTGQEVPQAVRTDYFSCAC